MNSRRAESLCVAALLLCAVAVYLPALSYSFVADDSSQILANTHIHSPQYIPAYFTSHVWAQISLTPGEQPAPYYRPVFLIWLLFNYLLFGPSPAGWHASAILLHAVVTFLVYLLAKRLLSDWRLGAGAALLFALHPVHIEAVDWISGATEPLMALPFLGALLCYIEAAHSARRRLWMAGSLALYFVAVLAKETAIVLPGVLIAYDLLLREAPSPAATGRAITGSAASGPAAHPRIGAMLRRISLFGLAAAGYWAMRAYALAGIIGVRDVPIPAVLNTWPAAAWFYIEHLLAPIRLSFFYNFFYIASFSAAAVLVPLALTALVLGLLALWARVNRTVAFAAILGILTMLPPLDLPVFLQFELVHDRYLYLPSAGFCVLIAMAATAAAGLFRWRPQTALALILTVAMVYGALTLRQSGYWANEAALFTRSFQIGSANWSAERNFAYAVARSGRCDEVLPLLRAFASASPNDSKTTFALGSCYFHLEHWNDAERLMLHTAQLEPKYQQPYLVLAAIRLRQGRIDDAEEAWRAAVRAQGPSEELSLHYVRGEILKAQGDLLDAAEEFRKELQVQPGNHEILAELASVGGS
jgi:protein O-mannosyl-transferase